MAKAVGASAIDYAFHLIVTRLPKRLEAQLDAAVRRGVTSFKLYMAYPELMVDDATIFQVMQAAAARGAMCCIHAENGPLIDALVRGALADGQRGAEWHSRTRPESAEAEAVNRAVCLARAAGAPVYLVHLSCEGAAAVVRTARQEGLGVFGETCPHYLVLDQSAYTGAEEEAAKYVMTPPLRDRAHQAALWGALARDELQVVATDHCPTCMSQRLHASDFSQIPNGAPGIEHRLALLYGRGVSTGALSLRRLVEVSSAAPARLFGLYPRKGAVSIGADADLVVFDPAGSTTISARTHHMNVDYSIYEGTTVAGAIRAVTLRGQVIVRDGRFTGTIGRGHYLSRSSSGCE
jgi:dihydropyrimidinase